MTLSTKIVLELAIATLDDALAAARNGADRLELNSALTLGGLTPSLGTLIEVCEAVQLPVVAMVRPRHGGFCYSAAEFKTMQRDVDLFLERGATGIAVGILQSDGNVDVGRCAQLVKQIGDDREAVFHRAFDVTPDPRKALDDIVQIGFKRVMTSGQQATAMEGAALIGDVLHRAAGRIEVLPAVGITKFTAANLLLMTGCRQVHTSLRMLRSDDTSCNARPHVHFNGTMTPGETRYPATDGAAVAALRKLLNGNT